MSRGCTQDQGNQLHAFRGYCIISLTLRCLPFLAYTLACKGILAGELKHGPLALIDENMPVIIIMTRDSLYPKVRALMHKIVFGGVLDFDILLCSHIGAVCLCTNYRSQGPADYHLQRR